MKKVKKCRECGEKFVISYPSQYERIKCPVCELVENGNYLIVDERKWNKFRKKIRKGGINEKSKKM